MTARAVGFGLALTPVNILLVLMSNNEVGWSTGFFSLFDNAVALLFVLTAGNVLLKRRWPGRAFGAGEMLTVYIMVALGTGLMSGMWDWGGSLAGTISYPFWFATAENKWKDLLWPVLPAWLTVRDPEVLASFFGGGGTAYSRPVIAAWARPAFWWAALVGALMWVCLCLNSIFRRRWEDEEKLPFPVAILPVQLAEERFGLFRNKLFWAGFAIAAGIGTWNTLLVRVFPNLFGIPVYWDYTAYLANRHPWEFIRYLDLAWGPWELGLCYLMPLDLTLSLLVFDLFWTAQYVTAGYLGWATSPWSGIPYGERQVVGALTALLIAVFWLDRGYLRQVARKALGLKSELREDGREALGYRAAVVGALAGIAFLWWALARAGMQSWAALAFLAMFFLLSLILCRVRAQLGPPAHELQGAMPDTTLFTLTGSRVMAPRTLGMLALLRPYLGVQRNNPIPIQLEALRMAEGERMERRRLGLVMAGLVPLVVLCYFWGSIHLGYDAGMGTGKVQFWHLRVPRETAQGLDDNLRYPTSPDVSGVIAMGVGVAFTLLLMWLKLTFQWWPLHPVAYPVALGWMVHRLVPPMFITWLLKSMLLRFGGLRAHRRALPLFLGLVTGSATQFWLQRCALMLLGAPL